MLPWRGALWSLGLLSLACEVPPEPPQSPVAESQEVAPSGPPEPTPQPATGTNRLTQRERRDNCSGSDQPAIVDFDRTTEPRTPVWECLRGCGPRFEYVRTPGRRHSHVECGPICAYDTHRSPTSGDCEPGAPPPREASAIVAEQRRQLEACVETTRDLLPQIEAHVVALERAPRPWHGVPEEWGVSWEELRQFAKVCAVRTPPEVLESVVDVWGPWVSKAEGRDGRRARLELLREVAPGLVKAADALAARLHRFDPLVAEDAALDSRASLQAQATDNCRHACDAIRDRCARTCVIVGTCAACEAAKNACDDKCDHAAR